MSAISDMNKPGCPISGKRLVERTKHELRRGVSQERRRPRHGRELRRPERQLQRSVARAEDGIPRRPNAGLFVEHDLFRKPVPTRIKSGTGFFGIMLLGLLL